MSIRFLRSGTPITELTIADGDQLSFPNGDWAVGFVVTFDGTITGATSNHTVFRTGSYNTFGNMICMWDAIDTGGVNAGKFYFQFDASTANQCHTIAVDTTKSYLVVLQRQSNVVTSKLCPVQATDPVGTAMVTTSASVGLTKALNGATGLVIGNHSTASRRWGNSLSRFFRIERALTDAEIAQLAYGKEITNFATPTWYVRMNDGADIIDRGSQANTITTGATFAQGGSPGFGFNSVPSAPVITGQPVINGSPVKDVSVGYTAAPATGNPSPNAPTQQWTIDGVDIPGASASTYTPTVGDVGKILRVRQISTNSEGTTTSTSDGAVVSSGAVEMTMVPILADRFYQQVAGSATVAMSGTFGGFSLAKVECQLYALDGTTVRRAWADVGATVSAGTWSATPSLPVPTDRKKYRIAFRGLDSSNTPVFTSTVHANWFAIGQILCAVGSSSAAVGWFGTSSGSGNTPNHESTSYLADRLWQKFDTYGQGSIMAEYISQAINMPVAFVNAGKGGTTLADWSDNTTPVWTGSGTNNLGGLTPHLALCDNKIAGLWGAAGANDVISSGAAPTVDAHLAKLRSLVTHVRNAVGDPNLPVMWSGINRRPDAVSDVVDRARAAENIFGDDPYVSHIQILEHATSGVDGIHLTGSGYAAVCNAMKYMWVERWKNGVYRRGPKINSIKFSGAVIEVAISYRNSGATNFTPTVDIDGFTVTDASGTPGILSRVQVSAGLIRITCDRALVTPVVKYLSGPAPSPVAPVFDSGATTSMPLYGETQMTAQEVFGVTIDTTPGGALAGGSSASISQPVVISAATAGAAAAGATATLDQQSRISASVAGAFAQGQGAVVDMTVRILAAPGGALADGRTATINAEMKIGTTVGGAAAQGLVAAANGFVTTVIGTAVGDAAAAGALATFLAPFVISAGTGSAAAAGAQALILAPVTISASSGGALAGGQLANVSQAVTTLIGASTGGALAEGVPASLVQVLTISCGVATATAQGMAAQLLGTTTVSCGVGNAQAAGQNASLSGRVVVTLTGSGRLTPRNRPVVYIKI